MVANEAREVMGALNGSYDLGFTRITLAAVGTEVDAGSLVKG